MTDADPQTATDAPPAGAAPADPRVADAVRSVWGFEALRPLQEEAIQAGVDNADCLAVMPTGGGKSLCYQVPPLVTGKAAVVISPLIALMRDQVRGLELSGYPAAALHSAVPPDEARDIERRLLQGEVKLVLAAPERAAGAAFRALLARLADSGRLGSIAIDEAHCISHWGHDFRREYRALAELRRIAPGVGVQAFTATATPRVRDDIARQLHLDQPRVLVGRFDRPNLTYRVRGRRDPADQVAEAFDALEKRGEGGGAIVYCLSRNDTEELAEKLRDRGLNADAYHAGLDPRTRHTVERRFSNEQLDIVVATVAFGMGIDRSNVRLVVHASMPKSVEAYQQETGRAGRDGLPAECLLLHRPSDAERWRKLVLRSAEESDADQQATNAQLGLLAEMRRFAAAYACRHRALSEHFGQTYEHDSCNACDVCLDETERDPDGTRICQILLSTVARTGSRFGAAHIADVARGARTEKINALGHDRLSVYGLLHDRTKRQLQQHLDQLVAARALDVDDHGSLVFGPRGVAVMKAEELVTLAAPIGAGRARADKRRSRRGDAEAPGVRPLTPRERALFDRLRALRKSIAEELGVPPYVVFSDATLRDMAKRTPATRVALLDVKGVGKQKLDNFGDRFLAEIAGFAGRADSA